MSHSITAFDWKAQETTGKHTTDRGRPTPCDDGYTEVFLVPEPELPRTHVGAMRYAVHRSGLDQYELADLMHVSHGHMSKVLHGTGGFYGQRMSDFMRRSRSLAPLQWLANDMGCDVVLRSFAAAEVAALRSRLLQLQGPRTA
jgi:transcriptional regulator with XRE-family HTH domain